MRFTTYWQANLLPIWQIPDKKKIPICEMAIYYIWTNSRQKNNYNYVRGYLLPIDRFQTKTIITIMWVGNLLPFDRFQRKKIITIMWEGNLLPFWRFQIITIMWDGNLLHFDRFQTKTIITIMREGNLLPLTDGNLLHFDRFQTKNYNYARGQITTYWQIPDKYDNYNYVRGQFTTFWQIPDKKITIMREGKLLPIDRFQTNIIIIELCERAIYYILTDSRQKNYYYNYARGQFTTFWQIPDKKITIRTYCRGKKLQLWANYYLLTDSRQI